MEIRKSLSTRSGKSLAAAAVSCVGGHGLAALSGDPFPSAAGPIGAVGIFAALLLLALGVLSTAGEWTHRTVQTTFLLVPQRGRVLAAKAVSLALMGAVLAAGATAASAGVLALTFGGDLGLATARVAVVPAGAAFAVTGAGVGAALGNAPAALTGLYVTVLGVIPVATVKPEISEKLDPVGSMITIVQHGSLPDADRRDHRLGRRLHRVLGMLVTPAPRGGLTGRPLAGPPPPPGRRPSGASWRPIPRSKC